MYPIRLMPSTIVWSWPWLGLTLSRPGFAAPVGSSPIGFP